MTALPPSRFTPSLMPAEQLERLFVARERTLEAVMERIRATTASESRNHTLLIGPRGAGKTHLIALAYHRTRALGSDGARAQVSWLPEDAWTIVSYRHLLASILEHLEPAVEGVHPSATDELERAIAARAAERGPIIVFVENLDQILGELQDIGQQQLRHFLQSSRALLFVASSTTLARSLAEQNAPFYGFFTTTRLEPLDVQQAAEMLTRLATERGDTELAAYLETDEGQSRLRTIDHLAGGQPRIWAVLASALTFDGLEELVEHLLVRFDDLTPYYQEQLARLSPQQRLIVAELARADRPLNVTGLADRLDIDQRSLGKTVNDLAERRWVEATSSPAAALLDQRRTYYELAEPLARISFQLKESRGRPLRIVVDFLKSWFDPTELVARSAEGTLEDYIRSALDSQGTDPILAVTRRLRGLDAGEVGTVELLAEIDDALADLQNSTPDPYLALPTPIRMALDERLEGLDSNQITRTRLEIHRGAHSEFGFVPNPMMGRWVERSRQLVDSAEAGPRPLAQAQLVGWLAGRWRFDEAMAIVRAAEDHPDADPLALRLMYAHLDRGYVSAGQMDASVSAAEQTAALVERAYGHEDPTTLMANVSLAMSLVIARRPEAAVDLLEQAVEVRPQSSDGLDAQNTARSALATALTFVGRGEEGVALQRDVVRTTAEALGLQHKDTLRAQSRLSLLFNATGHRTEAIKMMRLVVSGRAGLLGPNHRDTLSSTHELAGYLLTAGDLPGAITLEEAVLEQLEDVYGATDPETVDVRSALGLMYLVSGRPADGTALLEQSAADSAHVLGPDHPTTRRLQGKLAELVSGP